MRTSIYIQKGCTTRRKLLVLLERLLMPLRIRRLQVMIMRQLKSLLKQADNNFNQVLIGISIIMIGIFLWADKNYFFWPPQLRPLMNSEWSDIIFIILGICLLWTALTGNRSRRFQSILLIASSAAVAMLTVEQLWHVVFAHNLEMIMAVILDALVLAMLIRCAYKN